MELLTDKEGAMWRVTGNPHQVTVERRADLTQADVEKGVTLDTKPFRAISYHNRLDQALAWLLDYMLRMELAEADSSEFLERIEAWKTKLERVAEYWRQGIRATTYGKSFAEA